MALIYVVLCLTSLAIISISADTGSTDDILQKLQTKLQVLETTVFELQQTVIQQKEEMQHLKEKCSPNIPSQKRFVVNSESPVGFTAAVSPLKHPQLHDQETVKFETIMTEIGGGYNNASGVFVVPRSGIYLVSCSLLDDDTAGGYVIHAEIVQNHRVLGRVLAFGEDNVHRDQGAQTVITKANQGDQIWIRVKDFSSIFLGGELYSTFSAFLLYELQ